MYPSKMDRETDITFKMLQSIRKHANTKTEKNCVNWTFSDRIVYIYCEYTIKVHINSGIS